MIMEFGLAVILRSEQQHFLLFCIRLLSHISLRLKMKNQMKLQRYFNGRNANCKPHLIIEI